jgi:hypothetical protein
MVKAGCGEWDWMVESARLQQQDRRTVLGTECARRRGCRTMMMTERVCRARQRVNGMCTRNGLTKRPVAASMVLF